MQKSCINRLVLGDRNTAFHDMFTIVRRRRNHISSIKNDVGDWIQNEVEVMDFIRKGFSKLFTSSLDSAPLNLSPPSTWQATLTEEEMVRLSLPATDAEIKEGLWSMKAYKAPGLDGLHSRFFLRFWLVVGDSEKKEVKQIFMDSKVPEFLNRTNIALIPKIASP